MDFKNVKFLSDGSEIDNLSDLIFTSFTNSALVLLFLNSAEEFVVTSGVIISDGKLIGEVLFIFIEVSLEIVKLNKSSIASHELKKEKSNFQKTSYLEKNHIYEIKTSCPYSFIICVFKIGRAHV